MAAATKRAPRVCFLAERHLGIGTAAGAIEESIRALPDSRWVDVTYEPEPILRRLRLPHRAIGTLAGVCQTRTALQAGPYDALAFLTHNPAVLCQHALSRTPTLLWTDVTPALFDGLRGEYRHHIDSQWVRRLRHRLVRRTFRLASACVGWSEWVRRSFVNDYGIAPDKTYVVPPGIDLSRWTPGARVRRAETPRLLFVGGDFQRKGGPALLDVFRTRFRGRAVLDVVTRSHVSEEPGIRVHRSVHAGDAELLDLYRRADIFVLPTRADCYSIAALEAMATGLPVVASRVGGIDEIVTHGCTGYLVRPGDGTDLAAGIESLLRQPDTASVLGKNGRAAACGRFDAAHTGRRLTALIEQIARQALGVTSGARGSSRSASAAGPDNIVTTPGF